MTDFREQDLTGAAFERVTLQGAGIRQAHRNGASMHPVDLTGAQVRGTVFDVEWEHRLHAERDLTALETES